MIVLKDNGDGTFLGADEEGNLFDGTTGAVGYDELTVTTTITEDGFDRVTSYGDHVVSKGSMSRASFDAENMARAQNHADGLTAKEQSQDSERVWTPGELLDTWWADEVNLTSHDKAYYDMPPGMDAVEKTFSYTDWTAR